MEKSFLIYKIHPNGAGVLGPVFKTLLGHSGVYVPGSNSSSAPDSSILLMCTPGRQAGVASSAWVPASPVGDLD